MMPQTDKKNMIIAIALSAAIIFGWQFFYEMPRLEKQQAAQQAQQAEQAQQQLAQAASNAASTQSTGTQSTGTAATATAPGDATAASLPRAEALAQGPRVAIDAPKLKGSIALKGGRIDDLVLNHYRETIEPNSPNVVLLSPAKAQHAYFADTGWVGAPGVATPNAETLWSASGTTLTPQSPLTLTWDNGAGLVFTRKISIDDGYMFKVEESVANNGAATVALAPYSRVVRFGLPPSPSQTYVLHEGPMGVFDGTLNEESYSGVKDQAEDAEGNEPKSVNFASTGGWLGISDKYWLVAQIAPADASIKARYLYEPKLDSYQADYTADMRDVPAGGGSASFTHQVFAGAKEVRLLEAYRDNLGIPLFERAVDFGWFFFLTKPLHAFLDWIVRYIGNMGIAILLLTVCVKAVMFPLANKSYASMSKMKALQPKMAELKEQFGEDKARFQQEMMALYKKEKVNPAAGCLPILVQIPVFYALYKVLYVTIDMRQAPFFGWVHDLSMPDPTSFLNLFGLIPWEPHLYFNMPIVGAIIHLLSIGIWPLIMGFTMWAQMRLNPTPPDPVQAKMFAVMPFIFTFMLGSMPAGLVIYWAWNNTLSIAQQKYIMYSQAKKSAKLPKKA
ncbi:membrane protein insertase YidC [Dongia sp.]|uniref:membrane protein insertase YidC n=1 Tax=Dongia sp. TaxID=1977262 RepID=UPI0035B1C1D7